MGALATWQRGALLLNLGSRIVDGGPELMADGPAAMKNMVAKWTIDSAAADRLWDYALSAIENA